VGRYLPQGVQEKGYEIRSFMPKYGIINERRNQLHEVIRLSGMNIIINDIDRPLIIKVSSIPSARMQVYFIDNEDYFFRKYVFVNDKGEYFKDNDERAIFFARGVLETVKKLRWKPDLIHCQGWISHFLPLYLRKSYKDDPIFSESKVVISLYDDQKDLTFGESIRTKAVMHGVKAKDLEPLTPANGTNLAKLAVMYSNGIIMGSGEINQELSDLISKNAIPLLPYTDISQKDSAYIQEYLNFYDKILEKK
jgi:starch synthase